MECSPRLVLVLFLICFSTAHQISNNNNVTSPRNISISTKAKSCSDSTDCMLFVPDNYILTFSNRYYIKVPGAVDAILLDSIVLPNAGITDY